MNRPDPPLLCAECGRPHYRGAARCGSCKKRGPFCLACLDAKHTFCSDKDDAKEDA